MDETITNEKKRVGIVGFGKMGLLHSAIFNSLPESKVVAISDPSPFPRKPASKQNTGIAFYEDTDKMLTEAELDCVVITSPVACHVPQALSCIEKGIPFFMEKPLATTTESAKPLVDKLDERKIPNMIGFMTRFIDSFEKGKEILESNCLGRIQRVAGSIYVSQLFRKGKGWRYDPKISGGGCLISQGAHLLDLLAWYFGDVKRVNGDIISIYNPGIEDFAHLILEFDSGLHGWFDASWSVRNKRTVEINIDILGDNGSLIVSDDTVKLTLDETAGQWQAGRTVLRAPDLFRPVVVDIANPQYTREDRYFIQSLIKGDMPTPNISQGYHVQQIINAGYASAADNGNAKEIENN